MSTILLFAVSLIVVNTANLGIVETQTSANSYRVQQALAAAKAGMHYAVATLNKANNSVGAASLSAYDGSTGTGSYTVNITNAGTAPADADDVILVESIGVSEDGTATKTIKQELAFGAILHPYAYDLLQAPVIASGNVNLDAARINRGTAALMINAGGVVDANLTNDTSNLPAEVAGDSAAVAEITLSKNRILENNAKVTNLFAHTFANSSSSVMKHFAWQYDCATSCTNPSGLSGSTGYGRFHAISGNLTLSNVTVGSSANPVVLYVDLSNNKSLTLKNNTVINGVVYVKLDSGRSWNNGNNSATINGVLIVDSGETSSTVSASKLNLNFSQDNIYRVGIYSAIPGTWQDS